MKYGDTLQQRSIPLWESYNVDYNDIKHLIKVRTTQGQGKAQAIPGSDNEAKAFHGFEDELYRELREQHQRIDLFVQSKSGEIARRLAHLDKQIAHLEIRSCSTSNGKIPIRWLEKFSRAEEATLKAGEEIQFLSRFVGAQRLAFQKLLKKYEKWTRSSGLGNRFRKEVLDRPASFSNRDFEQLLAQWTEVLASVRAPFTDGGHWTSGSLKEGIQAARLKLERPSRKKFSSGNSEDQSDPSQSGPYDSSSAAKLQSTWENCSNVNIDTALAIVPLGTDASKAAYWIHPDNIVQIHVLLLQHTRLQKLNASIPPNSPSSSKSSPQGSISAHSNRSAPRTDEEISVIICDDLQRFAQRQSSETISDFENIPGIAAEKAAASIRCTSSGDAVVAVGTVSEEAGNSKKASKNYFPQKGSFKRKALVRMFSTSRADDCVNTNSPKDSELVSKWLSQHREVQPLVQLRARRTRFVGLRNSGAGGVWATLDKDIAMKGCSSELLASGRALSPASEDVKVDSETFPHAVLEVRVEGGVGSDLVAELDASHLTERVRGFSLETHAVARLCKPDGMPRPFWFPALRQDIRKVPAATKSAKVRTPQGRRSPEEANTRHTSISGGSTTNRPSSSGLSALLGESSATSAPEMIKPPLVGAFKKKRTHSQRKRLLRKATLGPSNTRQERYWNEFDDGSEGSEDEAYTIFVDPTASYSLPGAATVSNIFSSLTSNVEASKEKVASWFRQPQILKTNERRPLIDRFYSPSIDDSDNSDDVSSSNQNTPIVRRRYSTFPAIPQPPAVRSRERLLFRSCIATFASSILFFVVATILATTGRRKAATAVDAGVIIGVASSLVFAIIGVGSMLGRKDDVGWVHRAVVLLVFICIAFGNGGLLASLRHR